MDGHDQTSITDLIERARRGDASAQDQLFEGHRSWLVRWTRRKIRNWPGVKVAASDLFQETIISALRKFPRFEGRNIGGWLQGIMGNKIKEAARYWHQKKRNVKREVGLADAACFGTLLSGGNVNESEDGKWLKAALAEMNSDDRMLILLSYYDDLSSSEIAIKLGRNHNTVRSQVARGLTKLRDGINLLKRLEQERLLGFERGAICLKFFRALSQAEIAKHLGMPTGAVQQCLRDAKHAGILGESGDEP